METKHRIGFTIGAAVLLLSITFILGGLFLGSVAVVHFMTKPSDCPTCKCCDICGKCPCQCNPLLRPRIRPKSYFEDAINGDKSLPPVNEDARSEVKQQCTGCQPTGYHILPANVSYPPAAPHGLPLTNANKLAAQYGANVCMRDGGYYAELIDANRVWVSTGTIYTRVYREERLTAHQHLADEMAQGVMDRNSRRPVTPNSTEPPQPDRLDPNSTPAVDPVRQQIVFFHKPGDRTSERIKRLLETDPKLVALRSELNYQMYTADNKVYQTLTTQDGRALRDEVPESVFPALVCADPDGGHVYSAGPDELKLIDSPDELIGDIAQARHYKNKMKNELGGRLVTSGFGFDRYSDDCPNCPDASDDSDVGPDSRWTPGQRLRDLFGGGRDNVEGWAKDAIWGWADIIAGSVISLFAIVVTAGLLMAAGLGLLILVIWKVRS